MKRTALLLNIPKQEAPEKISGFVTAVSQVADYDGQQYLNIDLFYLGELKARYFADRFTYACYVDGSWRTCRLYNIARICMGKTVLKGNETYFRHDEWKWNTKEDEQIVRNYLGKEIDYYETCIGQEKYMNALQKKRNRIEEMMNKVPVLPENLEKWLRTTIFPQEYLFMKRKKSRTDYSCTVCGHKGWSKIGWKHNEKTTCPKCGQPVTACLNREKIQKKEPVVVLQIMDELEWVERQLQTRCTWTPGEKQIEIMEEIRVIIPRARNWGKVWYGTGCERDEFDQDFWDHNQTNKRFYKSYLYPENLKEVLAYGDSLQNSGLDILADIQRKINVNTFIVTFKARKWLEYWIKAGLIQLAEEVVELYGMWGNPEYIRTDGKKLTENLGLNGNRLHRLKEIDGGLDALKWLQYEEKREASGKKIKISKESLEFLSGKRVGTKECRKILNELGSVNRMVNYMKKQKINPNSLAQIWTDYLRMAQNEGLDVTDDIVRLPKDLKARHDELVERINARRDAEKVKKEAEKYERLNKEIVKHLPEAKRYFWENKDYMIIPAGQCEELIDEGRTLHHCVGASTRYMEKMAAGESWILFLRKKQELKKPYYTIEIDMEDDRILQWYSEYDRKPAEKQIKKLLDTFRKSIRKKPERIQIAV